MSVIIRLQNLPWTANAADIRHFFHGLAIPEGGVHIVGGQLGDAFIAFSTDEDARRGMALDGGLLKDSRVKLYLSSRTEMQNIIEEARQRHMALQAGLVNPVAMSSAFTRAPAGTNGGPFANVNMNASVRPFAPDMSGIGGAPSYVNQVRPMVNEPMGLVRPNAPFAQAYEPVAAQVERPPVMELPAGQRNFHPMLRQPHPGPQVADAGYSPRPLNGQHERGFFERNDLYEPTRLERGPAMNAAAESEYYPDQGRYRRSSERSDDRDRPQRDASRGRSHGGARDRSRRGRDHDRDRRARRSSRSRSRSGSRDHRRRSGSREKQRRHSRDRSSSGRSSRSGLLPTPAGKESPGESVPGACIQFRCLAGDLTYRVIRDYLGEMFLPNGNIKMVNSFDGSRFGLAYVKLSSIEDLQKAMSISNGSVRGHCIQILPVEDHVFEEVIDSYSPGIPLNPKHFAKSCLCFRDYPPIASAQNVREALGTISICKVVPERNQSGTVTGLCFVELANESDARKAIQLLRDGVMIAGRHVRATLLPLAELHVCANRIAKLGIAGNPSAGFQSAAAPAQSPASPPPPPITNLAPVKHLAGPAPDTPVSPGFEYSRAHFAPNEERLPPLQKATPFVRRVVLSGLPPSILERDIADFFSDVGVMPQTIEIVLDDDRMPVGEAYCQFASFQEAERALGKNGGFMGGNTVTVQLVNEAPMAIAENDIPPYANNDARMAPLGYDDQADVRRMSDERLRDPDVRPGPPPSSDDNFGGRARFGDHRFRGPRFAPERPGYGPPGAVEARGGGGGGGGGGYRHHGSRSRPPHPGPANGRVEPDCGAPPGGFGAPGCVVALSNVPQHAMIADIVDFFSGFRVNDKCVFRRFGANGEPTGDARVAFLSPDEADAAVRRLHNEYLLNRRVHLSIV